MLRNSESMTEEVLVQQPPFRNEDPALQSIADKIYAVLARHLSVSDEKPQSIVILRDGVSYGEEEKARSKRADIFRLLPTSSIASGYLH